MVFSARDISEGLLDSVGQCLNGLVLSLVVVTIFSLGTGDKVVKGFHLHIKILDLFVNNTDSLSMDRLGSCLDRAAVIIGSCPVILELVLELVSRLLHLVQHFTFLDIPGRHTFTVCVNSLLEICASSSDALLDLISLLVETRLLTLGMSVNQCRYLSHKLLTLVNGLATLLYQGILNTRRNGSVLQHDRICGSLELPPEGITLSSLGGDMLNKVLECRLEVFPESAIGLKAYLTVKHCHLIQHVRCYPLSRMGDGL
ncbi:hypothetical protein HG530_004278 [Fusarium avenaceum]|nr:hypothetical protein HG530_004278 [Fusarium avenaceum]